MVKYRPTIVLIAVRYASADERVFACGIHRMPRCLDDAGMRPYLGAGGAIGFHVEGSDHHGDTGGQRDRNNPDMGLAVRSMH